MLIEPRIVPRRRRVVWSPALRMLRPFLRYSIPRDAWVLRGIGERYGPVLRVRAAPSTAKLPSAAPIVPPVQAPPLPVRSRPRSTALALSGTLAVVLALAGVLVAAALGFTIARNSAGRTLPALVARASTAMIEVSVPSDWRRQSALTSPPLGLTNELVLGPAGSSGATLVIGRTVTSDPDLLPGPLLASLPQVPRPQLVTLGKVSFYRYLDLSPRGTSATESVYAAPSTVGTIIGVCSTRKSQPSFTSSCERSLGTLMLSSGKLLPPGPSPKYAAALDAIIRRLNAVRESLGSQLRGARAAQAQARAANQLAAAHLEAAAALLGLGAQPAGAAPAGPAIVANAAVAQALKVIGAAYGALGHAAAGHDAHAYATAAASLKRATAGLDSAFARLSALGYRVS